MSISIVNGFFCASSCDVAKAKKGENPHPSTDPSSKEPGRPDAPPGATHADRTAVVYGGALTSLNGTGPAIGVLPVANSQPTAPVSDGRPALDVLV